VGVRADDAAVATVHDPDYVAKMRALCVGGGGRHLSTLACHVAPLYSTIAFPPSTTTIWPVT
jgi:hypothetical protein